MTDTSAAPVLPTNQIDGPPREWQLERTKEAGEGEKTKDVTWRGQQREYNSYKSILEKEIIFLSQAPVNLCEDTLREKFQMPEFWSGVLPFLSEFPTAGGLKNAKTATINYLREFYCDDANELINEEMVVIVPGQNAALDMLVSSCCSPGDVVLCPVPFDDELPCCLGIRARVTVRGVQFEDLENPRLNILNFQTALDDARSKNESVRAILLQNPQSPPGVFFDFYELAPIFEWAFRNDLFVFVDESLGHTADWPEDGDQKFTSTLKLLETFRERANEARGKVVWMWSAGKDLCLPGLKFTAIFTQNSTLRSALQHLETLQPCAPLVQFVVIKLLEDLDWLGRFQIVKYNRLLENRKFTIDRLNRLRLGFVSPSAGTCILVNLRPFMNAETFEAEKTLREELADRGNVILSSGEQMGCNEPGWFKLTVSCQKELLGEALHRISTTLAVKERTDGIVCNGFLESEEFEQKQELNYELSYEQNLLASNLTEEAMAAEIDQNESMERWADEDEDEDRQAEDIQKSRPSQDVKLDGQEESQWEGKIDHWDVNNIEAAGLDTPKVAENKMEIVAETSRREASEISESSATTRAADEELLRQVFAHHKTTEHVADIEDETLRKVFAAFPAERLQWNGQSHDTLERVEKVAVIEADKQNDRVSTNIDRTAVENLEKITSDQPKTPPNSPKSVHWRWDPDKGSDRLSLISSSGFCISSNRTEGVGPEVPTTLTDFSFIEDIVKKSQSSGSRQPAMEILSHQPLSVEVSQRLPFESSDGSARIDTQSGQTQQLWSPESGVHSEGHVTEAFEHMHSRSEARQIPVGTRDQIWSRSDSGLAAESNASRSPVSPPPLPALAEVSRATDSIPDMDTSCVELAVETAQSKSFTEFEEREFTSHHTQDFVHGAFEHPLESSTPKRESRYMEQGFEESIEPPEDPSIRLELHSDMRHFASSRGPTVKTLEDSGVFVELFPGSLSIDFPLLIPMAPNDHMTMKTEETVTMVEEPRWQSSVTEFSLNHSEVSVRNQNQSDQDKQKATPVPVVPVFTEEELYQMVASTDEAQTRGESFITRPIPTSPSGEQSDDIQKYSDFKWEPIEDLPEIEPSTKMETKSAPTSDQFESLGKVTMASEDRQFVAENTVERREGFSESQLLSLLSEGSAFCPSPTKMEPESAVLEHHKTEVEVDLDSLKSNASSNVPAWSPLENTEVPQEREREIIEQPETEMKHVNYQEVTVVEEKIVQKVEMSEEKQQKKFSEALDELEMAEKENEGDRDLNLYGQMVRDGARELRHGEWASRTEKTPVSIIDSYNSMIKAKKEPALVEVDLQFNDVKIAKSVFALTDVILGVTPKEYATLNISSVTDNGMEVAQNISALKSRNVVDEYNATIRAKQQPPEKPPRENERFLRESEYDNEKRPEIVFDRERNVEIKRRENLDEVERYEDQYGRSAQGTWTDEMVDAYNQSEGGSGSMWKRPAKANQVHHHMHMARKPRSKSHQFDHFEGSGGRGRDQLVMEHRNITEVEFCGGGGGLLEDGAEISTTTTTTLNRIAPDEFFSHVNFGNSTGRNEKVRKYMESRRIRSYSDASAPSDQVRSRTETTYFVMRRVDGDDESRVQGNSRLHDTEESRDLACDSAKVERSVQTVEPVDLCCRLRLVASKKSVAPGEAASDKGPIHYEYLVCKNRKHACQTDHCNPDRLYTVRQSTMQARGEGNKVRREKDDRHFEQSGISRSEAVELSSSPDPEINDNRSHSPTRITISTVRTNRGIPIDRVSVRHTPGSNWIVSSVSRTTEFGFERTTLRQPYSSGLMREEHPYNST